MSRVLEKIGTHAELAAWGEQLRAKSITGEVTLAQVSPGVVRARVVLPGAVAVRPDPGLARPAPRPRRAGRVKLAVAGVVALLVLGAAGWLLYEAWVYRYLILGLLVVAAVLLAAAGSTRGGGAVIALFERGTVRWFRER